MRKNENKIERWTKLAVLLAEKNISMAELSRRTNIHVKTIHRAKQKGPMFVRMDTIEKIADALGVKFYELM